MKSPYGTYCEMLGKLERLERCACYRFGTPKEAEMLYIMETLRAIRTEMSGCDDVREAIEIFGREFYDNEHLQKLIKKYRLS